MADAARARKIAVRIKEIVAEALRTQIKDPRIGMITITDVKVTGDLHDATVYYTVLGADSEHTETAAALASATGLLRSTVGRLTGVKFTPTLAFVADVVPDTARHIDELVERAKAEDAKVRAASAGATFAGDADPYRIDDDDE